MTPYRFAVLGCGRMGRLHAGRLQLDARARIVGLYDADPSAAIRLQSELAEGDSDCVQPNALWSRDDVDAVVICTPTSSHYQQAIECRQRDWAVLCEKPLADTRERTRELIEIVRQGTAPFSLAYQRRSWASYRTLRREVRSGRWGAVQSVASYNCERWEQTIAGTWRNDPLINPGGFLGDAGSHKLDALFYGTGLDIAEVFARSNSSHSRVEIVTHVSALTAAGVPIVMDFVGNAHHLGEDLHVHCEHADLMVRDMQVWIARRNEVEPLTPLEPDSHPVAMFLDLLEGRAENIAPVECAWPVYEVTAAILESASSGRVVGMER
jgi:predicted dehydrogenase